MRNRSIAILAVLAAALIIGTTVVRTADDETGVYAADAATREAADLTRQESPLGSDAMGFFRRGPATQSSTPIGSPAEIAREQRGSTAEPSQAPQTYIGPDGKPQRIVYNQKMQLNHQQLAQLKAVILADMKQHPQAFAQAYGMEADEIRQIVLGKQEFPREILDQLATQ